MAHARHAPSTASAGQRLANSTVPSAGQLNTTAPATMAIMPSAMRRSKFSLKTNHAKSAVKTPSALSNNAALEAGIAVRPVISNTGPATPPVATAPASQSQSPRASWVVGDCRTWRNNQSPRPEPRYSNAASNQGPACSSSSFASGVPAPKSTAAASAAGMPESFNFIFSCHLWTCVQRNDRAHHARVRPRWSRPRSLGEQAHSRCRSGQHPALPDTNPAAL